MPARLKAFCDALEREVRVQLSPSLAPREDARAFGAQAERAVASFWGVFVNGQGGSVVPAGGARAPYDLAALVDGALLGVDVTTTDFDPERYADGGVSSVDAVLRLLAGADPARRATLILLELEHAASGSGRVVRNATALPLHVLPMSALRIENLGTGQLRLEQPLSELRDQAAWDATPSEFVVGLTALAIQHYERVASDARARITHLGAFRGQGHRDFRSWRRPRS